LYMLLCYLRDFVMLRYDNILDLTTRYEGKLELSKTVINGKQKLLYTVSMSDVRRQDRYLKENNPLKNVLRRIDFLLKTIVILLEMPLMQEVAKVPMIKPPITKTNVLKMNKNFKGAMALYDYIIAYDKQGYETETQVTTISPFREELADELAEAGSLISFLTYEYGLGIKNDLKASYNKEEERRKLERITQRAEKIKALQRRLRAAEIDIEEYTLTLEKQLRELEGVVTRAQELGAEVERLTLLSEEQVQTIGELTAEIEKLNSEIESLKAAHKAELEALKAAHEAELEALKAAHAEEITAIHTEYEARIVVLHADYQKQLEALRAEQASRIEEMRADYQGQLEAQKAHYTEQLDGVGQELSEKSQAFEALSQSHEALIEEHKIALARIKALGGMDATPMNREDFNRLEEEHKAFERWYASAWKQTKQKIRKDHINMKNFKGQKEQDKSSD